MMQTMTFAFDPRGLTICCYDAVGNTIHTQRLDMRDCLLTGFDPQRLAAMMRAGTTCYFCQEGRETSPDPAGISGELATVIDDASRLLEQRWKEQP